MFLLLKEDDDKDGPSQKFKNQDLALVILDTSVLHTFKKEICVISHQIYNLHEEIRYLKLTFVKIGKMLESVKLSFNQRIMILDDAIQKYNINISARDTLLDFL